MPIELIKHTFTTDELVDLGQKHAREQQDLQRLVDGKSAAAAEYAARIKETMERVRDFAKKVAQGFEMVEVEVMYLFDEPERDKKTVIRVEDNAQLRIDDMNRAEREQQGRFGFGDTDPDNPTDGKSAGAGE